MSNSSVANVQNELKPLMQNAEKLFDQAAHLGEAEAAKLNSKAIKLLDQAITRANEFQESAVRKGRKIVDYTDTYVHAKPWHAVSAAATIGLLVGVLLSRR